MNCEIVLINMKKDFGRYLYVNKIIELFNPQIINGNDCNIINEDGYIDIWKTKKEYTESAKLTKKNILTDFLKSDKDYLLILEDDIYMLNDLYDKDKLLLFIEKINKFIKTNPILVYFGICNNFICNNKIEDLEFKSFYSNNCKKISFGAHAFMINKKYVNILLMRINNSTLYGYPFDLSCLGYLQKIYPKQCFVCNPHIFIQNVEGSNIRNSINQITVLNELKLNNNYDEYIIGILKVTIKDISNIEEIIYFKKMITCLQPYIKVIYDDKFMLSNNIKFLIECKSDIKLKYNNINNFFKILLENNNTNMIIYNYNNIILFEIISIFNNEKNKDPKKHFFIDI